MEISITSNSLIIKAENVNIEEDIEQRIYYKKEDGKIDYTKPPKRDINTDILDQFVRVVDDLIEYRVGEYDSSQLIESLFKKLPDDSRNILLTELNNNYGN